MRPKTPGAPNRRRAAPPPARKPPLPAASSARLPLTRERIIASALALVDRDGLADFSLRRLGAFLGCEPMSIYHWFPSKAHLMDALIDDALRSVLVEPPDADPIDRLRAMAHSYLQVARRHPQLFPLVAVHRLNTPTGVGFIESVLALVQAAIPDDRLAAQYFRVLSYYVTGAALDETAGYANGPSAAEPVTDAYIEEHCPRLAAAARFHKPEWWASTFDLGLETLLDKMRAAAPLHALDDTVVLRTPKPIIHPKR
jgi:AcrR family transcriptional regulator